MHTVLSHKHPWYFCALAQVIVDHNDMFSSEKTTIDTHSQGGACDPQHLIKKNTQLQGQNVKLRNSDKLLDTFRVFVWRMA